MMDAVMLAALIFCFGLVKLFADFCEGQVDRQGETAQRSRCGTEENMTEKNGRRRGYGRIGRAGRSAGSLPGVCTD